jgi:hydroxypyruvate isomerase
LRYLANCSLLFTELPLLDRPAAAKRAGFDAIEFAWPFDSAQPSDADVEALIRALGDADVSLIGLSFFAGDVSAGDIGVLSMPARSDEFRESVVLAVSIGERLAVSYFNALYGNRVEGLDHSTQDELALNNLAFAAERAARIHASVLVEPVSNCERYSLRTTADAAAVVDQLRASGSSNVALLLNAYHRASNRLDPTEEIAAYADRIGHMRIGDTPGGGEPGSGDLAFDDLLSALSTHGYEGWVSLAYEPTTTTLESLDWLPRERRSSRIGVAP